MGSSGKKISAKPIQESEYIKAPDTGEQVVDGVTNFTSNVSSTVKWFNNPKMSNMAEWEKGLTPAQESAIDYYTGSGYINMNNDLYKTPWDQMTASMKQKAANLYEALNKFELHKAIHTVRQCDFQIFGASEYQSMTPEQVVSYLKNETSDGLIQVNGFLSSTTIPIGTYANKHGVWIDITTPANKGGGGYVSHKGGNDGEGEYLHNSNSVFKFDPNSVHKGKDGYVHVTATWVGQAKDQKFKKKNT